jgi:hypothetical protein
MPYRLHYLFERLHFLRIKPRNGRKTGFPTSTSSCGILLLLCAEAQVKLDTLPGSLPESVVHLLHLLLQLQYKIILAGLRLNIQC